MKKYKTIYGFNDFKLRLIGIPLISFLVPVVFFRVPIEDFKLSVTGFGWSLFYTTINWQFARWLNVALHCKYPELAQTKSRLAEALFWTLLFVGFVKVVTGIIGGGMDGEQENDIAFSSFVGVLMVHILLQAIHEGMYFYSSYQKTLVEKARLERENVQSQLEMLKSQVNPHFLFNSLNTLAAIIPEDPKLSVDFVQKLSKVYRYILEIREQKTIPLAEELKALEAYLFLLRIRFGDNLKVDIQVPEDMHSAEIVPLSLQMLIENAVKHNIISGGKPLLVEIKADNGNRLVIKNNLQRKNQVTGSTGFGLENIKTRCRMLAGEEAQVVVTAQSFMVILPLIPHVSHAYTAH